MKPGQVIISVWNLRAAVSHYEEVDGGISVVAAENWQQLEEQAIEEIEEQGGARNLSGHYSCSSGLASLARFS